jgi:hypothetical protein
MIPKANFPDPLIEERKARRTAYFFATIKTPWVIALAMLALLAALLHPAIVPVIWAVILILAWVNAQTRASREWWSLLAERLKMVVGDGNDLLPATPLLRSGDEREVQRDMADQSRILAQFRSTDVRNTDNGKERTHHDYTVVYSVDAAPPIRFLSAHGHSFSKLKWLGDEHRGRFPRDVDEFKTESVALHEKYELRSSNEDEVRARQIFSPTFMLWFARNGVQFEYENGALVVACDRTLDHAEEYKMLLSRADTIRRQLTGQQPDLG